MFKDLEREAESAPQYNTSVLSPGLRLYVEQVGEMHAIILKLNTSYIISNQ